MGCESWSRLPLLGVDMGMRAHAKDFAPAAQDEILSLVWNDGSSQVLSPKQLYRGREGGPLGRLI